MFPFTRGVYPSMYRGKLWTMRQFAGFPRHTLTTQGTPIDTCSSTVRPDSRPRSICPA